VNFLCPACRTPLVRDPSNPVATCKTCGVAVDLTRVDTAPGQAQLWPEIDLGGETLGPYRLIARIGAGGMGAVYSAEGPAGSCAVKVLSALLAADPAVRERFRREAAATRNVQHPGLVRVIEEGEERGFSWFAMERISGSDLRTKLESTGRLGASDVEALARRLLETLDAIHRAGLVHRDVKPSNILLDDAGAARLCDFGIARFDGKTTLTESAALLGSLQYMAPEQRRGQVSAASDLYSMGVVLFEALAGGVPGAAALPASTSRKMRRLLRRLLAEDVASRPESARAALAMLAPGPVWIAPAVVIAVLAIGAGIAGQQLWTAPVVAVVARDAAVRDGVVLDAAMVVPTATVTIPIEPVMPKPIKGPKAKVGNPPSKATKKPSKLAP